MSEFDPRISPEDVALWMEGRLKGHDLTPPEYYEKMTAGCVNVSGVDPAVCRRF